MNFLRCTLGLLALCSPACSSNIVDGDGSGGGAGGDAAGSSTSGMGSASSAGGGPLGEYPLVVQHADDGMRRLTFSTAVPLTCALSDPYEPDIFEGCDRYLLTAMIPEALLVTGAVLEDQVGGVGIIEASAGMADPPSSSSCPLSAGPPPIGAKLELVDVSDTVTARLTGFNGSSIFYTGQVDGEYTGALCSPGPGPQPGAGTARVWGSGTISLVVSSEAIDCTPDPVAPSACETWQLEFTFPESMLVPGPLDLHHPSVDSYAVGHGKLHENPSSPTDCSGGFGSGFGSVTIDAVTPSEVHFTLDDFTDNVSFIAVDGIYVAARCP